MKTFKQFLREDDVFKVPHFRTWDIGHVKTAFFAYPGEHADGLKEKIPAGQEVQFLIDKGGFVKFKIKNERFIVNNDTFYSSIQKAVEESVENPQRGEVFYANETFDAYQQPEIKPRHVDATTGLILNVYGIREDEKIYFIGKLRDFIVISTERQLGAYVYCTKEDFRKYMITKREFDRKFLDGLSESVELPTWSEWNDAAEKAAQHYQQECDDQRKSGDYPCPFPAKVEAPEYEENYWNPATGDFIIYVVDKHPESMDDGLYVRVDKKGNAFFVDLRRAMDMDNHPLVTMHDDDEMKEYAKSKLGGYITFRPEDLDSGLTEALDVTQLKKGEMYYFVEHTDAIMVMGKTQGLFTFYPGEKAEFVSIDKSAAGIPFVYMHTGYTPVYVSQRLFLKNAVTKEEYNKIFLNNLHDDDLE